MNRATELVLYGDEHPNKVTMNELINLEQIQSDLLMHESSIVQSVAAARYSLLCAADEIRRLRADAARAQVEIFNEVEAAAKLKISPDTLAKMRLADADFPHFKIGSLIRYTNWHIAEICERLEPRKRRSVLKEQRQKRKD